MIKFTPPKNITTININSNILNCNHTSSSNKKQTISKNHTFSHCNTRFKFSYKKKNNINTTITSKYSNYKQINHHPQKHSRTLSVTSNVHHPIGGDQAFQKQKQPSEQNQEIQYFKRMKSASHNKSISQDQVYPEKSKQQLKSKYNFKNGSFITFQHITPKTTRSLHFQANNCKRQSNLQTNISKNINDSCKITTIFLANPIHNNHKQYLLNKTHNESQEYHFDLSNQENLKEIYLEDLQRIQLSRIKFEKPSFYTAHTSERKKRGGKKRIQLFQDIQPKPWQSQQKNSLELFTKDTMG